MRQVPNRTDLAGDVLQRQFLGPLTRATALNVPQVRKLGADNGFECASQTVSVRNTRARDIDVHQAGRDNVSAT